MMQLQELINSYYIFKGMKIPDATDAHLFFVSEVGELADAIVSQKPGWVRNTPGKERNVEFEIGDCMQMLTVYALQMGLDPIECMISKWRSKGWRPSHEERRYAERDARWVRELDAGKSSKQIAFENHATDRNVRRRIAMARQAVHKRQELMP